MLQNGTVLQAVKCWLESSRSFPSRSPELPRPFATLALTRYNRPQPPPLPPPPLLPVAPLHPRSLAPPRNNAPVALGFQCIPSVHIPRIYVIRNTQRGYPSNVIENSNPVPRRIPEYQDRNVTSVRFYVAASSRRRMNPSLWCFRENIKFHIYVHLPFSPSLEGLLRKLYEIFLENNISHRLIFSSPQLMCS